MVFSIKWMPKSVVNPETHEKAGQGVITLGKFQERFTAPLDYWTAKAYREHWKQAIARIVQDSSVSCLVTSMYDPATANYIVWWPMYRVGEMVHLQNQLLFLENLPSPFVPSDPCLFVPERVTVNEEGEKVSEWSVPVQDMEIFLREQYCCDQGLAPIGE